MRSANRRADSNKVITASKSRSAAAPRIPPFSARARQVLASESPS